MNAAKKLIIKKIYDQKNTSADKRWQLLFQINT